MLSATGKCHTCGNESWVDECAGCWKARQYEQRTFLDLKGNATLWLPPARTDPRLETRSWRIAVDAFESEYVVYHGPGDLVFTYDNLRDALVDLGRYVVACNAMHRSMERRQVLS